MPLLTPTTSTKGTTFIYSVKQAKTGVGAPSETDTPFSVVISDCLTDKIDVEPLYESTNTDAVGHKVSIELSGVAHGFFASLENFSRGTNIYGKPIYGTLTDSNAAEKGPGLSVEAKVGNVEQILSALATPRGRLQYAIGDTIVYAIASSYDLRLQRQGQMDDSGGSTGYEDHTGMAIDQTPKITAHVTRVISDTSVHLTIKAEFNYQSCHQLKDNNDGAKEDTLDAVRKENRETIKSLRWWFVDDIDGRNWHTRRVIRGRLELLDRNVNVHKLRKFVLPPIQRGFRRHSIGLAESEDGMTMDFEIVDQEIYAAPPWPVSDWEGSASLTFPPMLVGPITANCDLTLTAPRHVPKPQVIALMIRMFNAKLHWYRKTAANSVFTEVFNISESMTENVVSGSLQLKFIYGVKDGGGNSYDGGNPTKQADNMYRIIRAIFGNDMSFDATRDIDPFSRGGFGGGGGGPDGPMRMPACPECPPPSGPSLAPYGGHLNGIKGYDPHLTNYWRPDDGPVKSIVRCALQNPCATIVPTLNNWELDERDFEPDSTKPRSSDGSENTPKGVPEDNEKLEETSFLPTVLTRLKPLDDPYFSYELSTTANITTGVKSFNSMGPLANNSKIPSTTISHQTASPSAEVTISMEAARLNAWPTSPNELSFVDPESNLGFICKGYNITAQYAKPDAVGTNSLYKIAGQVTYALTRAPKFDEPVFIASAPFIKAAVAEDQSGNVGYAVKENYLNVCDRKAGTRFRMIDNEDVCTPGDSGGTDDNGGGGSIV